MQAGKDVCMGRGVLLTLPRCCPDADVGEMLGMLLLPPGEALVERRGDLMGGGGGGW